MIRTTFFLALSLTNTGCFSMDFGSTADDDDYGSSGSSGGFFGGGSSSSSRGSSGPEYEPPPERCKPSASAWSEVRALHDDAEASVHELVTCGGMQTSMSRSMLAIIIASNRSLFDERSYDDLVDYGRTFGVQFDNPFDRGEDGLWSMPIQGRGASTFSLEFIDPDTGAVVDIDPFNLESYVTNVTASTSMTFDEMKRNPFRRNHVTCEWEEEGPLSFLLAGGGAIPKPFTMDISLADMGEYVLGFDISAGEPDYGPVASALDLHLRSQIDFIDEYGDTRIEYDVGGSETTIRECGESGVGFDLRRIEAFRGEFAIKGRAASLRYERMGALSGSIEFTVSGPEVDLVVVNDFGRGQAYPDVRWRCAE